MEIDARFWKFHNNNPNVYALLVRFARDIQQAGLKRYGVKALFERVRWHMSIETRGELFKLNNNFTSRYARLIEQHNPDLEGMFSNRKLHTTSSL